MSDPDVAGHRRHTCPPNTQEGRLNWKKLTDRPEVSVQAIDPDEPYHWVSVYGTSVGVVGEVPVLFYIKLDKVITFGAG